MINRLVLVLIVWCAIDLYFFQSIVTITSVLPSALGEGIQLGYWLVDALIMFLIAYGFFAPRITFSASKSVKWLVGLVILSLVPKLIASPLLLVEDIIRIINAFVSWLHHAPALAARNLAVSEWAIVIAAIPFTGIIYGMALGKYRYQVHRITLAFKDLPDAFNGFTLTHLSDIHSGSLINTRRVEKGVALANAQQSDIVVFTGDIVNNKASELAPWLDTFSRLSAPMGKYSVLGNHDYGDYIQWNSQTEKVENLEQLKNMHGQMGFRLLMNEHVTLEKNGQKLILAGVENWGKGSFARHGDLIKATAGIAPQDFTILLSHDPSHWELEVLRYPKRIDLTLSGHTHGMQFGIELFGFKWSPIKYMYPQWAGSYTKNDQVLYVNRGFGFLGFPGRVGIHPEITVITLQREA